MFAPQKRADVPTLCRCNGEVVSTGDFGHYLPSKRSNKDLDTVVFLKVLHTQLSILVAAKGHQTTTFCKAEKEIMKFYEMVTMY